MYSFFFVRIINLLFSFTIQNHMAWMLSGMSDFFSATRQLHIHLIKFLYFSFATFWDKAIEQPINKIPK